MTADSSEPTPGPGPKDGAPGARGDNGSGSEAAGRGPARSPGRAPRHKGRKRRLALRTLRLLAAIGIVGLLGLWWLLETDAASERVRRLLIEQGSAALGAPVSIGRLDLDVLPFHLEIHDVWVSLPRIDPAEPVRAGDLPRPADEELLARVDRLVLELSPWGLLDNKIVVLSLELERPAVRLDLPLPAGGGTTGGPLEMEIRRLRIDDGSLLFAHAELGVEGELEGIRVRMAPETEGLFAGPLAAGLGELRVAGGRLDLTDRYGDGAVLEPIEIRSVFGLRRRGLVIDDLVLVAGNSRIDAEGTMQALDRGELSVRADLAIDDIETVWRPPLDGDNDGRLSFVGDLVMRGGDPVVTGRVRSEDLLVDDLPVDSLGADLQLHSRRVTLRNLEVELFDGSAAGELSVDLSTPRPALTLDYRLTGLDAAALTRWDELEGWRLAGRLDAAGTLSWSGPFIETATGSGTMRVDLPGAGTVALARRLAASYRDRPPHEDAPEATRRLHGTPTLPLPVEADLEYRLAAGTLSVERSRITLPATTIDLSGRFELDGGVAGEVAVDSRDLRMLDHLVAQIRAATGEPEPQRLGLRGAATATLDLRGTTRAPVISGNVSGRDIALGAAEIGAVETTFQPEPGALVLAPLRISRRGGTAVGNARLGLGATKDRYALDLRLDGYDLAAEPAVAGARLPIDTVVDGTVSATGTYGGAPTARFDLSATELTVGRLGLRTAAVSGRIEPDAWILEAMTAQGLSGALEGSARWDPAGETIVADLTATELDLTAAGIVAEAPTEVAGTLSGQVHLEGPLAALDGRGSARWVGARVGVVPLGTVVAELTAENGLVALRALGDPTGGAVRAPPVPEALAPVTEDRFAAPATVSPPEGGWGVVATVSTQAPYPTTLQLRSQAGVAVGILAQLGQPLPEGATWEGDLRVEGSGPLADLAAWDGSALIDGFVLQQQPGFRLAADEVVVELADRRLTADAVLDSGAGPIRAVASADLASGALDGNLAGTIDAGALRLWEEALVVAGSADLTVDLGGTLERPVITGQVAVTDFAIDQGWKYPVADVDALFRLRGETVVLESLTGLVGDQPVRGEGRFPIAALTDDPIRPDARLEIDFHVQELPIGPLLQESEALSSLVSNGTISADVHVEGRGTNWREYGGSVAIGGLAIRMRDYDWRLEGRVVAPLDGGRVVFPEGTRVVGTRTSFGLTGHVELAPVRLDLNVDGRLGLEPLNVLSELWGTGGTAVADLRLYGPVDDLQFRGTADLEDVVLSPPPLRQPIDDISAHLVLEDRRILIQNVEGELGGGPLVGSGEMFLRDNEPQSFRFVASVDNALLRLEREVRVRVSADVVHDGTPERSLLSGSVRLIEGRYRRDLEAEDEILELLERPETDPDPLLASIHVDLNVDGDRGLLIDNNLAQVEVTADFQVTGTLAEPILLGRSVILDGELYWNDNIFEVLQGAVEFNNPFETEAFFEIRARTSIRRYTVDLNFSGSFERGIAFDYSSTPTLSDLDLFNLLAFGEEPDSAIFQDPYAYQQALGLQATRYLTEAYLAEVERGAERLFGVDRFRIAPTLTGSETDATARLTIGKRINSDVYVTYSRLLSNSEEQLLTVEYQLSRSVRLKGTRDEDGSFGIDFLVQKRIR